ncbi:MAG: metallophosphoesterase [Acetivibrio sp.]
MKVLIVSDSHGRNQYLGQVIKKVSPVDLIIHLGDLEGSESFLRENSSCPMEIVSGNNDYSTDFEREKEIFIGNYKVLLTHGHRYNVHYGTEKIKDWARENGASIVMFGHTHLPLIDLSSDIIALNPGSISLPRQEGHRPSYLIMEIDREGKAHFTLNYVK